MSIVIMVSYKLVTIISNNLFQVTTKGKFAGKWQVPLYMYNGPIYPSMLSGSGYVLSRKSAECMYKEALQIPYFNLEVIKLYRGRLYEKF